MNNSNNGNRKIIDAIISSSEGKINRSAVDAALNGDASELMNSLNAEDRKKLNNALKNEKNARELLSSDVAKRIMNTLLNGGR